MIEIKRRTYDRETETRLYTGDRWVGKNTNHSHHFDTFQEAKDWIVENTEKNLESARYQLQEAQSTNGNAKGLKEEKDQ
jgi:hypothetical protein